MVREGFHRRVGDVESQVDAMAALARGMLADGVRALQDLDRQKAASVVARRDELAQADEDIEHAILQLLILQSPMARDLRRMGCALKMITYLNRVGRYGYDIAHVAADWPEGRGHVANVVSLPEMAGKVEAMIGLVLDAYSRHAAPDAERLMELEEAVDALRFTVWRECLTYMAQDSHNIEACANYMMVARYLERCGDNVCKMAEKIHYAATGQRLLLH